MLIFSSILYAISASIDNFTVGIAYGIKKIRIGHIANLIIALISAAGTFASMFFGILICKFLPKNFSQYLGCFILIALGIWFILDYLKKENCSKSLLDNPIKADVDNSGDIDVKESMTLAFALTINNMGLGIGASITGLNIWYTTIFTFIISLLSTTLGCFLGRGYLSRIFGKAAPISAGIIIIVLGIIDLFI